MITPREAGSQQDPGQAPNPPSKFLMRTTTSAALPPDLCLNLETTGGGRLTPKRTIGQHPRDERHRIRRIQIDHALVACSNPPIQASPSARDPKSLSEIGTFGT